MLGEGRTPGDRVVLVVGNRLEWFDTTFGLLKAGLVRTYVNPRLSAPEVEYQLTDADVMAVVVSEEPAALLDRVALPPGGERPAERRGGTELVSPSRSRVSPVS